MDSLYIMAADHFLIKEHKGRQGVYHAFVKTASSLLEIKPRMIRDQFSWQYSQLVSELKLPDCLNHGGYKAPMNNCGPHRHSKTRYSDVRYNGPAVTSQFLAKDKCLLTWDITLAIVVPLDVQTRDALRQSMQAIIADNPDKMFPPSDVHLIPDVIENVWRPSTAQMEADILRAISKEGPMKKSLSFSKVLSGQLNQWNNTPGAIATCYVDVVNEILQHLEMYEEIKNTEETQKTLVEFDKKMRFCHIWIPSEKKKEYHEDAKSDVSINNAAIKHILFKAAFKRKGAFGSEGNMDMVRELTREVFETLGNEEVYTSEHAFLPGIHISHFSVSPATAHRKQDMARDSCRQCRILVQEAMTEVVLLVPLMFIIFE